MKPMGCNKGRDDILHALIDLGPMSARELSATLGRSLGYTNACLRGLMHRPKKIHVSDWVHDAEGSRRYLRAVYTAGPGTHAARPAPAQHPPGSAVKLAKFQASSIFRAAAKP